MTTTIEFLDALYTRDGNRLPGVLEFRLLRQKPNGSKDTAFRWPVITARAAVENHIAGALEQNADGYHVYFGVGPRKAAKRGKSGGGKADVLSITALWADLDHTDNPQLLYDFRLLPSIVVRSGGGFHGYWLLQQPVTDLAKVEAVLKAIADTLPGADRAVAEVARIMRLPGTVNTKPDRNGARCEVVDFHPDRFFDLTDFERLLPPPKKTSRAPVVIGSDQDVPRWIRDVIDKHDPLGDERNNAVFRLTMKIRENCPAMSETDVCALWSVWIEPDFPGIEIARAVKSAFSHTPDGRAAPTVKANGNGNGHHAPAPIVATAAPADEIVTKSGQFNLTDMGNGQRFAARNGQDARYCAAWGKWLVWDGQRWAVDKDGAIERRAKDTVRSIYSEASEAETKEQRIALASWAGRSESRTRIDNMIALARSEPGIPIAPDQLDANPWLLNCRNGTIDLTTGILHPHRRADMITKLARADYDPEAPAPSWRAFLAQVMGDRVELLEFLQRATGYALTGNIREQCLFLLYGTGANGKSTYLSTISGILGEYGQACEFTTFLSHDNSTGLRNDVARMKGARFLSAVENREGRKLDEVLVKQLTGGDTIAARYLHQEFFEFKPEVKIFLAANHMPTISGTDHAIWRRVHMIPFTVQIPEVEQVRDYHAQLVEREAAGILAWAVQGCLDWQADPLGLNAPDVVRAATSEYREKMDTLAAFLSDVCTVDQGAQVSSAAMYEAYKLWAANNGEHAAAQKKLAQQLIERGFTVARYTGGPHKGRKVWHGLGLLAEEKASQDMLLQ